METRTALVGSLLAASALSACAAAPAKAPTATSSRRLASDLAMLVVGAPPSDAEVARLEAELGGGDAAREAVIDRLLADPRFASNVAPEILFNKKAVDPIEEDAWEVLTASGSPPVYHLRAACDATEAVRVRPWWALSNEVLVCPDSYQPDHLRQAETGWSCGGANLAPARSGFCGCGPNLMGCARSEAQLRDVKAGLLRELIDTVAWVVGDDLPVARLFTSNETVRTGYSELFYQRWEVGLGLRDGVTDLGAWPDAKAPAPRRELTPGQHAGLLTSPQMLLYGDTPRARMRNAYADLWCVAPSSVDVGAQAVLDLGATDLRDGEGWRKLAAMPVCGDCHARLDYGMQFFDGYPSSFVGVMYAHKPGAPGVGPLFGHGPSDRRGEAALTPQGFASLAVKQPEFGRCVVRDVTDHVSNGAASPEDKAALAQVFERRGTLRAVMREALLRWARRASTGEGPARDLWARIDASCMGCHDHGPNTFRREALTPEQMLSMLRAVAFGDMPRPPMDLADGERRGLVRDLVNAIWSDAPSRAAAMGYFDLSTRGRPAHRGSAVLGLVEARAGGHDESASRWTFSDADRHDAVEVRPSFLATFALAALASCKAAGKSGAALSACLRRALDAQAATKPARAE